MKHALSKKSVEGIGVSLPGRIEPRTQRLAFAPNLHWPEFDLKAAIEAKTGLSVKLENAATACLLAELTFGDLDGIRDIVLITVSEGVGTGVYANGLLIAGHGGMAGEFGHVPLDPAGPLCACGQRGCWETFASCNAALRYYREAQPEAGPLTYPQLLHLAEEGNLHAQSSLDKQAHALGRGLRMIVAGLAPSMILIAGDVTSAWRRFGPILDAEAAAWTLAGTPPKIVPTHEGEIARLRGAAALVFQRRSPRVLTMGGEGRSC
jgi:predicted NBD/HSP70 family sugar kinase